MRISQRSIWQGVSASVSLSVLVLFGILLLSARRTVSEAWRQVPLVAFIAGAVAIILVWLAKAGRMYVIARAMGARVRFGRFLQIYLTTCFVSHITPFSAGGVPMQVFLVHREGMSIGAATALTAVDLGLNLVIFAIVVPAVLSLRREGLVYRIPGWLWWVLAILGVMVVAGSIWRRLSTPAGARAKDLLKHWRREYGLFKRGLSDLASAGAWVFAAAIVLTFFYWLFYLLVAPIVLAGLGVRIPWAYVLGAQLVFNFLQILLPTPGGSGGSELLLLGVFAPILRRGQAGVFILVWKFYTFYSTLFLGGLSFWLLLRRDHTALREGIELDGDPSPGPSRE